MAIGPEARQMASGRIVVVAGFYAVLGVAATILGLGPLLRPADLGTRAVAIIGIIGGATLVVGALGLTFSTRFGRPLGLLGGMAALGLGLMITVLAVQALESCGGTPNAQGCSAIIIGLAVVGLLVGCGGIGAVAIVRRARPDVLAWRRR